MRANPVPIAFAPALRAEEPAQEGVTTFAHFYDEHLAFVWRNVRQLAGLECNVDDIVQEVFLVVFRRLSEFDGRSARSWLYSILRRVVSDHRRGVQRRKIRDSVDLEGVAAPDTSPDCKVEKIQALRTLFEMLDELDEVKREVFVLAEIEGMSAPQIAECVGINTTTVHARLRDARRDLAVQVGRRRARDEWRLR
jgi:RNA polymerase sigma-70 factor (ECF subfamily)